jgi:hypothetical protein
MFVGFFSPLSMSNLMHVRCNSPSVGRGPISRIAGIRPRSGQFAKQRYMLAVMYGRSTYKLTWEEILRLYRLTLDAGAIHCSSAGSVREVLAGLVCAMSVWNVGATCHAH